MKEVIVCSILVIEVSFNSLEQFLNPLPQLKQLTIEATGTRDLLDGLRWEEFLKRKELIKFIFKFDLSRNLLCNQSEFELLKAFRSSFWLEEKHWYVACHKNQSDNKCPSIYSAPYFIPQSAGYLIASFRPLSTVPSYVEKQVFYDRNIDNLEWYSISQKGHQTYRYTKVNSLRVIHGCSPFNLNILTSVVDLSRVRILDVSSIDHISAQQLHVLFEHTPRLYHLTMRQINDSLILPAHIISVHLKRNSSNDSISFVNIDHLRCELSHIKQLEIKVRTQEMMIQIIERFDQLESIIFQWPGFLSASYTSSEWFQQNTRRLHENNFTCRTGYYPERDKIRRKIGCGYQPPTLFIYLSIANNVAKQSPLENDQSSYIGWVLTIFQRGWRQFFPLN
jgi:hypothetical protein